MLRARASALLCAARTGAAQHAAWRADELDGELLRPPAGLGERRLTAPTSTASMGAASSTPTSATRAPSAASTPSRSCAPCNGAWRPAPQFMLPTEDAIAVAEELARRWGLPAWQFTLSASQANTEALRLARHATGRSRVLSFTGNYGGHGDELLAAFAGEGRLSYLGLPPDAARDLDVVQFNDLDALERALTPRGARLRPHRTGADQRGRRAARARLPREAASPDTRARHTARARRDPHADLRTGRADAGVVARARRRRGRQGDRRRPAVRRLRHERRAGRRLRARPEPGRRAGRAGHRRHAVRQCAEHGRRAGGADARSSRPRPTRIRRRSARAWPTASRPSSRAPHCPGRSSVCTRARA